MCVRAFVRACVCVWGCLIHSSSLQVHCPVYLVNVSSVSAADVIAAARMQGEFVCMCALYTHTLIFHPIAVMGRYTGGGSVVREH